MRFLVLLCIVVLARGETWVEKYDAWTKAGLKPGWTVEVFEEGSQRCHCMVPETEPSSTGLNFIDLSTAVSYQSSFDVVIIPSPSFNQTTTTTRKPTNTPTTTSTFTTTTTPPTTTTKPTTTTTSTTTTTPTTTSTSTTTTTPTTTSTTTTPTTTSTTTTPTTTSTTTTPTTTSTTTTPTTTSTSTTTTTPTTTSTSTTTTTPTTTSTTTTPTTTTSTSTTTTTSTTPTTTTSTSTSTSTSSTSTSTSTTTTSTTEASGNVWTGACNEEVTMSGGMVFYWTSPQYDGVTDYAVNDYTCTLTVTIPSTYMMFMANMEFEKPSRIFETGSCSGDNLKFISSAGVPVSVCGDVSAQTWTETQVFNGPLTFSLTWTSVAKDAGEDVGFKLKITGTDLMG